MLPPSINERARGLLTCRVSLSQITLFDGSTVEAYKVVNTFTITSDTEVQEGYVEQYWVRGLGMVKEIYIDAATQAVHMSKDLSGYSGLSVVE